MNAFISKMFGLSDLRLGDEGVVLDFARPFPAWTWLLIGLTAVALAAWSYRHLDGRRAPRAALASLRALSMLLVALMLSGPQLSKPTTSVERDWVVGLLDRSLSMRVKDAQTASAARVSRDTQLRDAIDASASFWTAQDQARNLLWLSVGQGAAKSPALAGVPQFVEPTARASDLGSGLAEALRQTAARPLAAMVLFSDGRATAPIDQAVLDQLVGRQAPVFVVPLGDPAAGVDLSVVSAEAPPAAFANDRVPVAVRVARTPGPTPTDAKVRLVDAQSGATLDEQPLAFAQDADSASVILSGTPQGSGNRSWRVEIIVPVPDLSPENDRAPLALRVVDRPLRVAYFDGYPRWEYRYLKNLLVREASVRSSISLLAPQRRYLQEGTDPILTLPRSADDWRAFDVVVLGDLTPDVFSNDQLATLADHIAKDGAGLLMIGGPGPMPNAWRSTPLGDLIPFSTAGGDAVQTWLEPVLVRRSPAADRLGILRLGDSASDPWPGVLTDPTAGWSTLRFAQRIAMAQMKPATEILAEAFPAAAESTAAPGPLVLSMRFGAGLVVYVASDEIWRWRYGRGETLPERFWLPIVRMLARQGLASAGRVATLEASPQRAIVDAPVQISARILDQGLLDSRPKTVNVRITPVADASIESSAPTTRAVDLALAPTGAAGPGSISGTFGTIWIPTEPGLYEASFSDPLLARDEQKVTIDVRFSDDELRNPSADHTTMADLARKTGGQVVRPADLNKLADLIPSREVRLLGTPIVTTLWDRWPVWILLVGLLGLEWVGRRLVRLP